MKRFSLTNLLTPLFFCLLAASPAEAALTAEEIVGKANLAAYYAGNDGSAQVTMTITDEQGRTRNREFSMLRRDVADGGAQTFYVYFRKPADVRKMVFMVHKQIGRDDDRWLYLPALDLVKRIAASDKRTSFVGSHFLYEDVSGRSPEDDRHELLDASGPVYQLKHTPKDPKTVEFSYYTTRIDKTTFLPLKIDYFDRQGTKYRVVEALEVKTIGGHPTVVKSRVQDLAGGGETVSVFENVRYDLGLSADIFTERYLRTPPKEVRK
jgi:hypothetical protein